MMEILESMPFSMLPDNALEDFKRSHELFMSIEELRRCRDYYKEKGYVDISETTLRLLDSISAEIRKNTDNILITSFEADSKDIFETYVDLASKQNKLSRIKNAPLPMSAIADVANGYSKITRKRTPAFIDMSATYNADGTPTFPAIDYICKTQVALPPATALVLVYPTEKMSKASYMRAVNSFISCDGLSDKIILTRQISHGGILKTLSSIASGVLLNIHALPDMPKAGDLSHLTGAHHGRFIIAINKANIEFATILAEYYGLSITYFAKTIFGDKLVFIPANNISDTVDLPLVRILTSAKTAHNARTKESSSAITDPLPLFNSKGEPSAACGALILRGDSFGAVCATRLGDTPFCASMNAAIHAVLPIIASGVDRSDIALRVRYTLSERTDEASLGESISAMLGIYRVMSELYLSGESTVEYTDRTDPSVAVTAFSNKKNAKVLKKLIQENSGVYFLSFDRTERGMPSFESFRAMCDFHSECLKNKSILSAAAVIGSVENTLKKMSSDFECKIHDSARPFLNGAVSGIIVESSVPLRHGVFLGSTVLKTDTL